MMPKENNDSLPQKQQNGSLNIGELYKTNGGNKLSELTVSYQAIKDLT